MEIINLNNKTITTYTIDYNNGIFCDVELINEKLVSYNFRNDKFTTLEYIKNVSNIKKRNKLRFKHLVKQNKIVSLDKLKNFNEFDNLFYFNYYYGYVRKYNGKYVSVLEPNRMFYSLDWDINEIKNIDIIKKMEIDYDSHKIGQVYVSILLSDDDYNDCLTHIDEIPFNDYSRFRNKVNEIINHPNFKIM